MAITAGRTTALVEAGGEARSGGVFAPAPENKTVGLWRNSLQATWADYDRDGDPDLYVANDWGPDNLLRNDGAAGFTTGVNLVGSVGAETAFLLFWIVVALVVWDVVGLCCGRKPWRR